MNTKTLMTVLLAMTGAGAGFAAQNGEMRREEKRLMVAGGAGANVPSPAERAPVTFLGVAVAPAEPVLTAQLRLPEGQGLVVNLVELDSPAAKAGIQEHDVITKLDDQILIDPRQLSVLVRNRKEGEKVTLSYVRAGAEARATATLATHVPGPETFMHWKGGHPADVFFRAERFAPGAEIELLAPDGPRAIPFHLRVPGPDGPPVPVGSSASRVMIYRPQAGVVFSDDAGSLEMQLGDEGQNLTAKDSQGEVIFSGPINTPEQRAALPEDLRQRLEKFESLDVFEAPVPSAGAHSFAPDERLRAAAPVL